MLSSTELAAMKGACVEDFTLQQLRPCEQGIVLQHCIACPGDMGYEQSTAYVASARRTAANKVVLTKYIVSRLVRCTAASQYLPVGSRQYQMDRLCHMLRDERTSLYPDDLRCR